MIKKGLAIILLFSSLCLFGLKFYQEQKIDQQNEELISDFFKEEEEKPQEEKKEEYIGVLEIPKISLKRGFYSYSSPLNQVDKNIELISSNCNPHDACHFLLASHSGNSSISFFKHLNLLKLGDEAKLYYENETFIYHLKEIQHVEKNGTISLRTPDVSELVLTTCNKENDTLQDIYIFE